MAATTTATDTATVTDTATITDTETETASRFHLESLFKYGSDLSELLREVKFSNGSIRRTLSSRNKQTKIPFPEDFPERFKALVKDFLKDLKVAQGSISEDSIAKVMGIIEGIVQKLVHIDKANAKTYEELADDVENFQSTTQHHPSSVLDLKWSSNAADVDIDFEIKYNNLSNDERRCLFYVTLFPAGTVMKKTELICLWIGMASLEWHADGDVAAGEKVLSTLVSEGFIHRLTRHNTLFNRYRMCAGVHTKVIEKAAANPSAPMWQSQTKNYGSFNIHCVGPEINELPYNKVAVKAVVNNGTNSINYTTLRGIDLISLLLLHLGSCIGYHEDEDGADYIVVEDIGSLNDILKRTQGLRYLSLRGISGMVELPSSISALSRDLRVLDLRACNNLESLPKEIDSLNQLIYLDLSECYLLSHIPNNIASLSQLRVLKGFIISPDSYSSCDLSHLSKMKLLNKLTIRTRRKNFPTTDDLFNLCQMDQLHTLGIAWGRQPVRARSDLVIFGELPMELHKLELQAVPESIASQLLGLISKQQDSRLKKLYIRGAFGKLDLDRYPLPYVKHLRLRYLPQLDMKWSRFKAIFTSLTRLEIFECPKLNDIPLDENGVWDGNVGA